LANCLSHTPHAHVEREKLEQSKAKLEELSKVNAKSERRLTHDRTLAARFTSI
jgi:hypothetical protein